MIKYLQSSEYVSRKVFVGLCGVRFHDTGADQRPSDSQLRCKGPRVTKNCKAITGTSRKWEAGCHRLLDDLEKSPCTLGAFTMAAMNALDLGVATEVKQENE